MFQVMQPDLSEKHARQYRQVVRSKSPIFQKKSASLIGQPASLLQKADPARALEQMTTGKPMTKMNPQRNSSVNLLNPAADDANYHNEKAAKYTPKRAKLTPKDNGMGLILSYADAGVYREDTSRMGGVTSKIV